MILSQKFKKNADVILKFKKKKVLKSKSQVEIEIFLYQVYGWNKNVRVMIEASNNLSYLLSKYKLSKDDVVTLI